MWWITAAYAVTLEGAWRAAENNPDLLAVFAQAEAAQARVGQSRAAWLPKVVANASVNATDEDIFLDVGAALPPAVLDLTGPIPPTVVQPDRWFQTSATVVLPLVDVDGWLRTGAAMQASEAASYDAGSVRQQIRAGVASAFYGAFVAHEGVAIARDAVALAVQQEDIAQRLVAAGAATERTALEAIQARFAAERDLAAAIALETRAVEALHRLTGLPRDTVIELGFAVALPQDADTALALAREQRPDLSAARARAAAATRATRAASAGWVPDLSARLTGLYNENQGLADDAWFLIGAVEATWTFDGGYRAGLVRESRSVAAAANAGVGSAERVMEQQIAEAFAERVRSRASLRAAEQEVAAARAAAEQAQKAFESGAATFVEVDRASLGLRVARLSEARERAAVEHSDVALWMAIAP